MKAIIYLSKVLFELSPKVHITRAPTYEYVGSPVIAKLGIANHFQFLKDFITLNYR